MCLLIPTILATSKRARHRSKLWKIRWTFCRENVQMEMQLPRSPTIPMSEMRRPSEFISTTFYKKNKNSSIFFWEKITKTNCNLRKAVQNTFIQKSASKMLMKLRHCVDFTNILQSAFSPIVFRQKNNEPNL